jgi:hypothetical protein
VNSPADAVLVVAQQRTGVERPLDLDERLEHGEPIPPSIAGPR